MDSGKWTIAGDNGFRIEKRMLCSGVEGKRLHRSDGDFQLDHANHIFSTLNIMMGLRII